MKEKLESELGEVWAPYIMIDKDQAEHKAVAALGLQYLLHDFHIQKIWQDKTRAAFSAGMNTIFTNSSNHFINLHNNLQT